ncbi:MAG: hypothetical protein ABJE66_27500 [Deltaproteobacteria bacterium]
MQWLAFVLVLLLPAVALAKPKVAVAALDNDADGKITSVLVDAADDHATVTKPTKVEKAMDKLSLSELDKKALKKLRIELEVEVIIHGKVGRENGKRHVELVLSGKGKKQMTIDVPIGSPKSLKKDLSKRLDKKIEEMTGGDEDPDEEDQPKKLSDTSDDKPKKHADDDRPKKHDDDDRHAKKHVASDEEVSASDEDTGRKHHRRKHHGDDDAPRNPMTTGAVWADVGAEVARRTLTWSATGTTRPPHVGTAAGAARIGGEVYPFAFDSPSGGPAGLGFYADYARTVGLSIAVPGTTLKTPIKDGHYEVGARYRFVFGDTSIAVGGAYWRRYYMADRSSLMMPTQLDMPDVDYAAFAPGAEARIAATPTVAAFLSFDVPLVMASGDIQSATSYGKGTVIAFDVLGGVQILLGPHYALQLAGAFDQVGIKFQALPNSLAQTRGVSAATDRSYGVNATIGILY